MKIYLTRHGQTKWNIEGKMQGWNNSDLTEKGIENAMMLGKRLSNITFDHIYSSPANRALDTAKYIRGDKATPITTHDELKEMGFGIWEGMKKEDVEANYPNEIHNFWKRPDLYQPVNGETFEELIFRVNQILHYIRKQPYENVLVVTHTVTIKAIYYIINQYHLSLLWSPPYIHDTSLTLIEADENRLEIILEADISHIDQSAI